MGEEVGTMQFRVQGEQVKNEYKEKEKEKIIRKEKIYMYIYLSMYDINKVNSPVL
jgi:hypothetical protein